MINLVEDALDDNGMGNAYVRLDGSMSLQQRDKALKDFQNVNSMFSLSFLMSNIHSIF